MKNSSRSHKEKGHSTSRSNPRSARTEGRNRHISSKSMTADKAGPGDYSLPSNFGARVVEGHKKNQPSFSMGKTDRF